MAKWTSEDIEYLRLHAATKTRKQLSDELGFSYLAVDQKCRLIGVKPINVPHTNRAHTMKTHELAKLKEIAAEHTMRELISIFNRAYCTIKYQLRKMGVSSKPGIRVLQGKKTEYRHWTPEEDEELQRLAGNSSTEDIAVKLGRSLPSVRKRAATLGLRLYFYNRPWTKQEMNFLLFKCDHVPVKLLAKQLKRSYQSVKSMMVLKGYRSLQAVSSLSQVIKDTGYNDRQLLRARDALGQHWKVYTRRRGKQMNQYLLSSQQVEDLCEWLKNERWKRDTLPSTG